MTKIIHIITRLDRGGSAENTLYTCLELAGKYRMILVHGLSKESRMTAWERHSVQRRIEEAAHRGVRVTPLPALVRKIDPLNDLRTVVSLCRMFMREKPDIVHTHTSKAGLLGRWAARLARVPIIIHTPHGHVFYGHFGPFASKFFMVLEKMTAWATDCLVALTKTEKDDYIRFGVCGSKKMVTIHSGVDIERFESVSVDARQKKIELGLDPQTLVVGTVGWLLPIKGPMVLLEAMAGVWKDFPDVTLAYVGKGDLKADLQREAERLNRSDRVVFLGWRDDIPEIMKVFDLFVLPSLNEGMGRVLVEAMAAGRPIVASRVGGIRDLVKHFRNGLLVAPGDVAGLSRAIADALNNPVLREDMGRRGKAMAREFSTANMIQKIDALYESMMNNRSSNAQPAANGRVADHDKEEKTL